MISEPRHNNIAGTLSDQKPCEPDFLAFVHHFAFLGKGPGPEQGELIVFSQVAMGTLLIAGRGSLSLVRLLSRKPYFFERQSCQLPTSLTNILADEADLSPHLPVADPAPRFVCLGLCVRVSVTF
jgi:hypothetical protein